MLAASRKRSPFTPVAFARSLPARSTRQILLVRELRWHAQTATSPHKRIPARSFCFRVYTHSRHRNDIGLRAYRAQRPESDSNPTALALQQDEPLQYDGYLQRAGTMGRLSVPCILNRGFRIDAHFGTVYAIGVIYLTSWSASLSTSLLSAPPPCDSFMVDVTVM